MKRTVLKNGQIVLLDQKRVLKGNIVFNDSGCIEYVGTNPVVLDEHTQVIDCQNKYIFPGLINAHAHLFASGKPLNLQIPAFVTRIGYMMLKTSVGNALLRKIMHQNAQTQLQSGVTTLRSVGEFFYQDVRLRDWYESGESLGPTLQVSGFFLTTTEGHGAPYLALEGDSPWEGRKNVRKNLRQGIDWIKICVTGGVTDALRIGEAGALQLTEEEIEAICEEAHKVGRMVAAHVESTEGVRIAFRAGVDSIEHGAVMDEEIIELYKKNPKSYRGYTTLVPTFQAAAPFALLKKEETQVSDIVYENGKIVYEAMLASFHEAVGQGIALGAGNDASMSFVTHYDFWRELDHFVRYGGITPAQALEIATLGNAKLLGIDTDYGSIEAGKKADLLVLSENPLENVRHLNTIEQVYKHGQLVEKKTVKRYPEIDRLLDQY
ncbi:amidohydrolase family protein [Enterococcus casseliflavus]|nr:amidohydrolase family protein [Enterococcus casseliflavus]